MVFNPNKSIQYFEPGSIRCACCGWKPEDAWDTSPEGFIFSDELGYWQCEECEKDNSGEEK